MTASVLRCAEPIVEGGGPLFGGIGGFPGHLDGDWREGIKRPHDEPCVASLRSKPYLKQGSPVSADGSVGQAQEAAQVFADA